MGLSRKKSQKMTFEMKQRTDQRREMLGTIAATVFPQVSSIGNGAEQETTRKAGWGQTLRTQKTKLRNVHSILDADLGAANKRSGR